MAYRRYRKRGIRPRRKARVARRSQRMPRRMMGRTRISRQIHNFRELIILSDIVDPGTLSTSGYFYNMSFDWSQIPQIAQYTNLYDQIKINKLKWFIEPYIQPSNASSAATPLQKWARVVWDYDDATSITEAQALQYANVKSHNFGYKFSVGCYPKIKSEVYSGAYKIVSPGFMDLQATSPTFQCAKMVYPSLGYTGSNAIARVRLEVDFSCRKQI